MSGIIDDLLYVRVSAPDLDLLETFLTDLGLVRSARTADALYMRGTDSPHHIYIAERGPAAIVGIGFAALGAAGLAAAAALPGASEPAPTDEPGGGRRVTLREPNGYRIELVDGLAQLPVIAVERPESNTAREPNRRAGRRHWGADRPAHVKRLGHTVLATPRHVETQAWFEQLGMLKSDRLVEDGTDDWYSTFNRVDRGSDYVDHHAVLITRAPNVGWHHFAFEVQDIDEVMAGRAYLGKVGRWDMLWEGGRHGIGGQVGSYWADPWGRGHEIWSDGDRMIADEEMLVHERSTLREKPRWNDPSPRFPTVHS